MGRTENVVTIDDSYPVTVPASVREAAGIDAGDTIQWVVDDAGAVGVEVVGEETHTAADHDLLAGDR